MVKDIGGEPDWAHAPPEGSPSSAVAHLLDEHLQAVACLAYEFASTDVRSLAQAAGLWHDLGKRRPGFQRYIRQAGGAAEHVSQRASTFHGLSRQTPHEECT